jgi:uncharacterized membrane protein
MSEFIVSISVIMSFNAAQKGNINQGIGTSVMVSNGVLVTALSYCLMREKVSVLQFIGIISIFAGVIAVSLYGPDKSQSGITNEDVDTKQ